MKLPRQLSERLPLLTTRPVLLWAALLGALILYWAISAWQVSQLLQHKLVTLNSAQQINLSLLHQHSHQRLIRLREQLPSADAVLWLQQHRDALHHQLLLFSPDGRLQTTLNQRTPYPEPSLTGQDLQWLSRPGQTRMASTLSFDQGHFLPFCQRLPEQQGILCLLTSTSSPLLQWQASGHLPHSAMRIVRSDGVLLLASPLPVSRQHLLGKPLTPDTGVPEQRALIAALESSGVSQRPQLLHAAFNPDLQIWQIAGLPYAIVLQRWLGHILWGSLLLITLGVLAGYILRQQRRQQQQARQQQQLLQEELTQQQQEAQRLFRTLPGSLYRLHLPEHRLHLLGHGLQPVFSAELQYRLQELPSLLALIHSDDQQLYLRRTEDAARTGQDYDIMYRLQISPGQIQWVRDRGHVLTAADDSLMLEGLLLDVTDQTLSKQHVDYLATRDPLTELMNRYSFNDELINTIDRLRPQQDTLALLFIDLDRFKTVNDSLGHQVGDRLLQQAAERLRRTVGPQHRIARLGGDEFVVMMISPEDRDAVVRMAETIIGALKVPYELDHYRLNSSCSIGISLCPEDSAESYILLRNADTAMYHAKARGGNVWQFFTSAMNEQAHSRLTLENELRRAISNHEFELWYQPQVRTTDNHLIGAEALLRWRHPTAGMVSPADFIPIAEETGLIRDIGDWALQEACRTFSRWNEQYGLNLTIAVNVSVRQLDDEFVLRVQEVLHQTGLPARHLELEITESLLMDNVQDNIRLLESINRFGVRFAMDDFGTGYSSLSYLKQFPISKLKIDRAFINDITRDPEDEVIVRAITAMAHSLKLGLVAEGVENDQQLALLQHMRCDCYQGYLFSKPLPEDEFCNRLLKPACGEPVQSQQ